LLDFKNFNWKKSSSSFSRSFIAFYDNLFCIMTSNCLKQSAMTICISLIVFELSIYINFEFYLLI
jgi:hypothetical protein